MDPIINPHNELSMPKRNLPRDVFLHLFAMVALYWVAISFITLCWQYINYYFPDALAMQYGGNSYAGVIRFAVASLVIMFPLFMAVSWYLNNIYRQESSVRESKIRKWLIYLTLFITSLIIIGDLVTIIYNFLGGEISARFVLKALVVLVVAAVVFVYYLDDVRKPAPSTLAKPFAWATGLVILGLVIGAFFIVGSPMTARQSQFDQQRIADLQSIQYQVVYSWQRKGVMPATLADLNDSISGYVAPVDPETNMPYEYRVTGASALAFELCTTFNLASDTASPKAVPTYPYDSMSQNWNHAAGHVCFARAIDPQLYPPLDKGK